MKTVAEVMTADVKTARSDEVVGPIRDLMLDGGIHGVPVVDPAGDLVGIVTSSDLVEEWAPEQGVVTVMSDHVETVSPHTTLGEAAFRMIAERVHHLVVVQEEGRVAGIVSSFDLLRALAETVEEAQSKRLPPQAHASPGDVVVIRGHAIGQRERRGVIVEARGADGGPPFVVHWLDDRHAEPHDVLFYPGSDADVEPREAEGEPAGSRR
jgi:CBS domain-containing protein